MPTDPGSLVEELASRITQTYLDTATELQRLVDAASELGVFDSAGLAPDQAVIDEALEELRDALLPAPWDGRRLKHTDVQRSELAEIIAASVLSENYLAIIPASRVAHKEIPDQQSRGADVVGFEALEAFLDDREAEVVLVLSEVKGSIAQESPPGVIAEMETKLLDLCSNRRHLIQELTWVRDHASDETIEACSLIHAAFVLKKLDIAILLAPVLLRTAATEGASDTGNFEADPGRFAPSRIRFHTVVVDEDLFELAGRAYLRARLG